MLHTWSPGKQQLITFVEIIGPVPKFSTSCRYCLFASSHGHHTFLQSMALWFQLLRHPRCIYLFVCINDQPKGVQALLCAFPLWPGHVWGIASHQISGEGKPTWRMTLKTLLTHFKRLYNLKPFTANLSQKWHEKLMRTFSGRNFML